jgi:hypothetical protein
VLRRGGFTPQQTGDATVNRNLDAIAAALAVLDERVATARSEPAVQLATGSAVMTGASVVLDYRGSGGHIAVLPPADAAGLGKSRPVYVMNNGPGILTVAAAARNLVNGAKSVSVAAGTVIVVASDGESQWRASIPGPATAIRETGGPTDLAIGAIPDGYLLGRSGASIIGVGEGTDYHSFCHAPGNSGLSPYAIAGFSGGLQPTANPLAMTANQLYAMPFVAPRRGGTVTKLAWRSTGSTGNGRLGVYTNKAANDLYPGTLLGETGSVAQTNALKTTTVSIGPLTPGQLYWLVYCASGSNTIYSLHFQHGATSSFLGYEPSNTYTPAGILVAFTFGALPSTFPGSGTLTVDPNNGIPLLMYQVT